MTKPSDGTLVRAVAMGAFALGALGACGATDEEPPDPPPALTPSVMETTTAPAEESTKPEATARSLPDAPTKPPEMAGDDVDGAVAAAEYFLLLYPYVYATGDLDEWQAMSHPDCNFCASVISNVTSLHSNGGHSEGPTIDITHTSGSAPEGEYKFFSAWLDVEAGEIRRFDEDSNLVELFPASFLEVDLALEKSDSTWQVRGVVQNLLIEEDDHL